MAASLADRIQQLLNERQQHADAVARIDQTLGQISSLLGSPKSGRGLSATSALQPKRRGRRRGRFETTGRESVLAFVKERRNPTTREINANWKKEGRGGTADSLLGEMVKQGKLKRKPLGGKLGSQYLMA